MQHEGDPFGRRQRLEHDEQRQADIVGKLGLALGIGSRAAWPAAGSRLAVQRLLAPRLARAQGVEADAGDHRGQPAAEIVDAGGIGAAQPQPGFLHGIVGLARRAQHAVGDPLQMAAVGLELLGQPFFFFHRSHSPIALRHSPDGRNPADVTKEMIMQARMTNPVFVVPEALKALNSLGTSISKGGVPNTTLELVRLRASQINGCSFCVEMHARDLKKAGEKDERLFTVAAWRETPYFTDAERAALALTEAATRLNDRADPVNDEIWNEAARHYDEKAMADLVLNIALINFWNRVNVPIRQVAGVLPKAA